MAASGNASEDYTYEEADYVKMTLPIQIPTAIGLVVLIIVAIGGNLMTIIAYITDQRTPSFYDFYIFHLAVTDLLISAISMPFYAVYTLMEFTWPFGYAFCKAWLAADFTFCFESIVLMLLLSLDRLLMLQLGPHYSLRMTMKLARIQIVVSWILSFLVYGPAIIGWNHWMGYSTVEEDDCDVEFVFNFHFTAVTSVIEFVLPFIILSSMNIVIFIKIRKRGSVTPGVRSIPPASQISQTMNTNVTAIFINPRQADSQEAAQTSTNSEYNDNQVGACTSKNTKHNASKRGVHTSTNIKHNNSAEGAYTSKNSEYNDKQCESSEGITRTSTNNKHSASEDGAHTSTNSEHNNSVAGAQLLTNNRHNNRIKLHPGNSSRSGGNSRNVRQTTQQSQVQVKRDLRAARFLSILVATFLILWAPYTVTTMVIAFCGDKCLNISLYEFFNWVLWFKSAVNPLLYATNSSFYRRHFIRYLRYAVRVLTCKCKRQSAVENGYM